ncbi:MAG: hypothetical protein HY696_00335 [Deltaproteobacteria bacterium]|nr:hypothetical protein [Deltaproteobacteria bacterium]
MKLAAQLQSLLTTHQTAHRGVFSTDELRALLGTVHEKSLQRAIQDLQHTGTLTRFCRGLYVTAAFDLEMVSQRLAPNSYISCGSALARALLIGSIPQKTVYAVKQGVSRMYRSAVGSVIHFGFGAPTRDLFFGYCATANGICYADSEKAWLDTLYFYQSGYCFSFDIYSDVDMSRLNGARIRRYLRRYKNPRFVQFVKGVLAHAVDRVE